MLFTIGMLAQTRVPPTSLPADPASDLVRVRAFLTTTSTAVDITIGGAEWANAVTPTSGARVNNDGQTIHVLRDTGGEADVQLDVILASLRPDTTVTWTIAPAAPGSSSLEVFNLNGASTRAVDRFDAGSSAGHFSSQANALRDGGPLPAIEPIAHHPVLAVFYPWWTLSTWTSETQIYDSPVPPYSTDDPADLQRIMTAAQRTGIDALLMSWSGPQTVDHARMLRCLAAAQNVGFKMAAFFETTVANPAHVDGGADPDTVLAWLRVVVDDYASQPAYFRVGGRPVVVAYAAQRMSQAGWKDALGRLRASGRDVLLIGEGSSNTRLGGMDGQFYYPSNDRQGAALAAFEHQQALNVRTYHLLPGDTIGRRVWAATVSPGYDDTHIKDGRVPRVTDRAGGEYYKTQWRLAFDNRADWIIVSTWNEYLENTEIEATRLYGDLYVTLTRGWTTTFRALYRQAVRR